MPEPTEKAMPNFPFGQGGWWQLLCLVHAGWYAVGTNPCPGPSLWAARPTLRVSPSTPSGRATVGTLCAWVAGACLWPDSDILARLGEAKSTPVNQETETRALVTPATRSLLQTRRHPSDWQDQVPAHAITQPTRSAPQITQLACGLRLQRLYQSFTSPWEGEEVVKSCSSHPDRPIAALCSASKSCHPKVSLPLGCSEAERGVCVTRQNKEPADMQSFHFMVTVTVWNRFPLWLQINSKRVFLIPFCQKLKPNKNKIIKYQSCRKKKICSQ